MNKINYKLNKGFTIIETIVALSIFVVSVLVMIVVASGGINSTKVSLNKTTATFLADEGLELVRNIRDNYALGSGMTGLSEWGDFSTGIVGKCSEANDGCRIRPRFVLNNTDEIIDCSGGNVGCTGHTLNFVTNYKYFGYVEDDSSSIPTIYTRTIYADAVNVDILKVRSVVEWRQGAKTYNVEVAEYLYNWFSI